MLKFPNFIRNSFLMYSSLILYNLGYEMHSILGLPVQIISKIAS